MLKNYKKGFTIIEVLIVLAIAGLILLIVFLAVPGLQRNSRNTAIKTDVQNVLGGVAEFQAANNGQLPGPTNAISIDAGTPGKVLYQRAGGNTTSINIQPNTQVSSNTVAPSTSNTPDLGTIVISIGFKCPVPPQTTGTATPRAIAATYSIETANDPARQCTDS